MKILKTMKHEFVQVLPPTLYFFVAFNVIALTKALMLKQHGISFSGFATASLGALIVGKVILFSDKLPIINIFQEKPLIYNSVVNSSCTLLQHSCFDLLSILSHFFENTIKSI